MKLYVTYSWIVLAVAIGLNPTARGAHSEEPAPPPKGGHRIDSPYSAPEKFDRLVDALKKAELLRLKENVKSDGTKEDLDLDQKKREPLVKWAEFFRDYRVQLFACQHKQRDTSAEPMGKFLEGYVAMLSEKMAPEKKGVVAGGLEQKKLILYANKFNEIAKKRLTVFEDQKAGFEEQDKKLGKFANLTARSIFGPFSSNDVSDEDAAKEPELNKILEEANAVMKSIQSFADSDVTVKACKMGAAASDGTPTPTPVPKADDKKGGVTPTPTATPVPKLEPTKKLQPAPPAGTPGKTPGGDPDKGLPPPPGAGPVNPDPGAIPPGAFPQGTGAFDPNALLGALQNDLGNKLNDFANQFGRAIEALRNRDALADQQKDRDDDIAAKLAAALAGQKRNEDQGQQQQPSSPQVALAPPDKGQPPPQLPSQVPQEPPQGPPPPNPFAGIPPLQPPPAVAANPEPSPAPYQPKALPLLPFGPPNQFNPTAMLTQLRADRERARIEALRAARPMPRRRPPQFANGRPIPRPLPPGVRPPVGVALRPNGGLPVGAVPGARTVPPFAVTRARAGR